MEKAAVTAEDLLAGARMIQQIPVPKQVLPTNDPGSENELMVSLKPLTIGTFQLILKAAANDKSLVPLLMIKEALVEPRLSLEQVKSLPIGTIVFLMQHIREISGLLKKKC